MPIIGFTILEAIDAPISAWAVAVILKPSKAWLRITAYHNFRP